MTVKYTVKVGIAMQKNDEFDFDMEFQKEFGDDTGVLPDGYGEDELLAEFLDAPLPGENDPAPLTPPEDPQPEPEPDLDLSDIDFGPMEEEPESFDLPREELHFDPPMQAESAMEEPEVPNFLSDPTPEPETPPARKKSPPPLSRAEQRRLQKRRMRKIKQVYLPAALAGISLLLMLIFIIGGISRGTAARKEKEDADKQASENQVSASEALEKEAAELLQQAKLLAAGYNYQGAIDLLDSFSGELTSYPELLAAKSEYAQQLTNVKAWNDPKDVVNLSFHVLIADPARAFTDKTYGTAYNKSFVTTDEFQRILQQLYDNGYVLVGLDDIVTETTTDNGTVTYSANTIYLPTGKTPIMITETMVNYFKYMVDPDKDGKPDAKGGGFANKLVVTEDGDIKAQLVTADGESVTGDYDLVPILESFIAEHPDFAYNDARAILAVCGQDGVFGYRINDKDASTAEVNDAKALVQALRDKGYTIACYTYDNLSYNDVGISGVQQDLESWNNEIKPVLGDVDVMVFARGIDLSEYTGAKFDMLYTSGFRYFLGAATAPAAEVTSTYFHQKRLMVTGSQMAYNSTMYTKYFNSMNILSDKRGTVPTA